jgi:hypothetical protein
MQRYESQDRDTGVSAYHSGKGYIDIQFKDGRTYRYSHKKPGKVAVNEMKRLAAEGKGLTTYINKYARKNYEQKIK